MKKNKRYYLGLDIGTDSIGYAVTDLSYNLINHKGQAMWGAGLFDEAISCAERRGFRTARRRLDRRQQRVRLLRDFFAKEIAKVDPEFFVRIRESALFAEDRTNPLDNQSIFNDSSFKDADFHHKYPTIHHLIVELMNDDSPHDPRLVYIACAWLIAHRGHFLSEIDVRNVGAFNDVSVLYSNFMNYIQDSLIDEESEVEPEPLWSCDPQAFGDILTLRGGVKIKSEKMQELLWGGKKPKDENDARYSRIDLIKMLCGGKVKASNLFKSKKEEYAEVAEFYLSDEEEKLEAIIGELGDDGELIRKAKELYDWGLLFEVRRGCSYISESKIKVYEQHKKDLHDLKDFLKKYSKKLYRKVLVDDSIIENYVSYIGKSKAFDGNSKKRKRATKIVFSDWLKMQMLNVKPDQADRAFYEDMMDRLETYSFLPKQIDGDNRVIPRQLYQYELREILSNATKYLPFLAERDLYGSVAEKIESIFSFRVPYYVGPLVDKNKSPFAWMVRKAEGDILPWNFSDKVDLDRSEDEFIRRMTNVCTYIPGEDVLPARSLKYEMFKVLNELNPLKISGAAITPALKEQIVENVFKRQKKVKLTSIIKELRLSGLFTEGDTIEGVDEEIKSSLSTYHDFKGWLEKGILSEDDVESIVLRLSCTTDTYRMQEWLSKQSFSGKLTQVDIRKISRLKYSEFGRFSSRFLSGIEFVSLESGEKGSVLDFMRRENVVLMELLSSKYTLVAELDKIAKAYYSANPSSIEDRMKEMYVSSAVKRQIYRALGVVKTVKKAMGRSPEKIFVEMARGGTQEQKGKRTQTRVDQLLEKYRRVRDEEVKEINAELVAMGDGAHNRLQSDALYLWYLQLGRCAYCGKPLAIESLKVEADIDHIHPQSLVKDDSVLNNKVLTCKRCNGEKRDQYPIPEELRQEALWQHWYRNGLMTEEKFRRLMRRESLTEADKQGFINRQLVETRQTTKAVFTLLHDLFPESELIAVKAGNVSDVRHHFMMSKCRSLNDLHHAKDAYLNIVVGNVYHERFTRNFSFSQNYSMKVSAIFGERKFENSRGVFWNGVETISLIKAIMLRNDIHLTKFQYYAGGGFFDQMPLVAGNGETPRKAKLHIDKYGGYAKPAAAGFVLVRYEMKKGRELILVPIRLLDKAIIDGDDEVAATKLVERAICAIDNKFVKIIDFPLGRRLLRVNTRFNFDDYAYVVAGKSGGGKDMVVRSLTPFTLTTDDESYIKRLESVLEKMKKNKKIQVDEKYDKISVIGNCQLYDRIISIASSSFKNVPSSQLDVLKCGREIFANLHILEQIKILMQVVQLYKTNRAGSSDLTGINGAKMAGVLILGTKFSNLKKRYSRVCLVDMDFTGIYSRESINLLDLI